MKLYYSSCAILGKVTDDESAVMNLLKKINDFLSWILGACSLVLVVVFTCVVFLQVMARNYLLISVPWTDEVALIFFVWSVLLGAAVGLRKRSHFLVDLFPKSYVRVNSLMDFIAGLLVLVMVVVFLWCGVTFTRMGLRRNFSSIIVSQAWLFVSMPLSSVCMLLFSAENIVHDTQRLKEAFFVRREAKSEGDV